MTIKWVKYVRRLEQDLARELMARDPAGKEGSLHKVTTADRSRQEKAPHPTTSHQTKSERKRARKMLDQVRDSS